MKSKLNYLPKQYQDNKIHKINHSYLVEQFFDYKKIFSKIEKIVKNGDYTLGNEVNKFEKSLSKEWVQNLLLQLVMVLTHYTWH